MIKTKNAQNSMTKILVIGNGFDIAHGLPTTYENFLDFAYEVSTQFDDFHWKEVFVEYGDIERGRKKLTKGGIDVLNSIIAKVSPADNIAKPLLEENGEEFFEAVQRLRDDILASRYDVSDLEGAMSINAKNR